MRGFPAFEAATVNFTREKLERLKTAKAEAEKAGQPVFRFDDNDYFVGYAKYLIEYLESQQLA